MKQLYKYNWGNNEKRAELKGRVYELLARDKSPMNNRKGMNSRKVRFIDNGQIEIISGNAIRKVK